jgi:hypothetical protein
MQRLGSVVPTAQSRVLGLCLLHSLLPGANTETIMAAAATEADGLK